MNLDKLASWATRRRQERAQINLPALLAATAKAFRVSPAAIMGRGRVQPLAFARQVAMAVLVNEDHSAADVGRVFQRTSKNVLHACQKVAAVAGAPSDPRRDKIKFVLNTYHQMKHE